MRHRVALLVVVGRARYPDLATAFVATRTRIFSFLDQQNPPFIAKVYRPSATETASDANAAGTITLWYPAR